MTKEGLEQPKRWSAGKKREVVLRLLRGEPLDEVSRDVGVESYRLEQWREQALLGMNEMLKERTGDPLTKELDRAKKRIGELSMENELLYARCRKQTPLARGRLKR